MGTTTPLLSIVRDLARCGHTAPARVLSGGAVWCPRCGALALETGGWCQSSGARALVGVLGVDALTDEARRLYLDVEGREPFATTLAALVTAWGMRPVFELVQADLLLLDERDRVAALAPGEDALARANALAAAGNDVTVMARPGGAVVLRVVRP